MTSRCYDADISGRFLEQYAGDLSLVMYMTKGQTVQIILRWHMQMGLGAVPGSRSKEHIEENRNIFDFMLLREEMEQIAGVSKHRLFYQVTAESLKKNGNDKMQF